METLIAKIKKGDKNTISANLVTKNNELSKIVKNAISECVYEENGKIRTKFYHGAGRYISLYDYTFYITSILNRLGYKYKTGNDAPRGGKKGDFIKVSKVALNALKSLIS